MAASGWSSSPDQLRARRRLARAPARGRRPIWSGTATTSVDGFDAVVLPGGFAHGDYLRPGAIARFSPVMEAVGRFAADGGPVVGICNGFQVLTEAGLLPGALQKNRGLRFLCTTVTVRVESAASVLTAGVPVGTELRIPINHFEGNYTCDARDRWPCCGPRNGSCCATWTIPTARSTTSPGCATRRATWSGSCPTPNGPATRCWARRRQRAAPGVAGLGGVAPADRAAAAVGAAAEAPDQDRYRRGPTGSAAGAGDLGLLEYRGADPDRPPG